MFKFSPLATDYNNENHEVFVICPYLTEGWSTMSMQREEMRSTSELEKETAAQLPGQLELDVKMLEDCLLVANQLAGVIQDETEALKAFDTDLLLQLITKKEALVKNLGGKLNVLRQTTNGLPYGADRSQEGWATRESVENLDFSGSAAKRLMLRDVLSEIERGNEINRIFIEGSLAYGDELLELFIPGSYTVGQEGQAERLTPTTKGLALDKEA